MPNEQIKVYTYLLFSSFAGIFRALETKNPAAGLALFISLAVLGMGLDMFTNG